MAATTLSLITCPYCSHSSEEQMPANACQFFYDCKECGARLKPKPGEQLTAPESRPKSVAERAMRSVLGMTQS